MEKKKDSKNKIGHFKQYNLEFINNDNNIDSLDLFKFAMVFGCLNLTPRAHASYGPKF